jgi:hypothetical protein
MAHVRDFNPGPYLLRGDLMVVQCPFCKQDWAEKVLIDIDGGFNEAGQCDCGAWWYEGLEDSLEIEQESYDWDDEQVRKKRVVG